MSYLKYNLQLFAKDGPGGEKTEPATAKKLSDARKEGQVAKSTEIVSAIYLLVIFYIFDFLLGYIGEHVLENYNVVYSAIPTYASEAEDMTSINSIGEIMMNLITTVIIILAPVMAITMLLNTVTNIVQVKWQITAKPMKPKFNKISPKSGVKKIFSKQSLVNMLKSISIVSICIYVVYEAWLDNYMLMYKLFDMPLMDALIAIGDVVLGICEDISMIYIIIGLIDYVFQKHKFKEDMKMTKQEVKDEYKNSEGDPQVKGQQKRRMREASMRRMMQKLPEADVVITNPTHFAVALKYDLEVAGAPIVIAKGEDFLAQKIKEVARENKIEIVENKPLARALYHSVEVGDEIPQELYQAVAEVLAYVFSLKKK